MTPGESDYWPKGEAYEPEPDPGPEIERCPICSARHREPVPWCARDNTEPENTHG